MNINVTFLSHCIVLVHTQTSREGAGWNHYTDVKGITLCIGFEGARWNLY